jgi:CzcA family heavy metal efflux pump
LNIDNGQRGILGDIVRFSLRFRSVTIVLACLLVGYGLFTLTRARYDVFPEFAPSQVVVHTEAPGLTPEQVEILITRPVENAVNGVPGIESVRSNSIQGLSAVTVRFESTADIYRARQEVAERLAAITGLPEGARPEMTPLTSSTGTIMTVGLTSNKRSAMALRTIADWTVKLRFLAVPGVAKVAVFGGEVKQLQVQVRPDRLIKYNLSLDDVLTAAGRATGVRGAGFIDTENQRIQLQPQGQPLTSEQLSGSVIMYSGGAPVTLGNIANVVDAPEPPIGAASVMGKPGVVLVASSQYGANTIEVTQKLEQAVDDLRPLLAAQGIDVYPDLFKPADFIQTSVHNIWSSIQIGAVLVVVVLFLFLFNLRSAAISCTAIPLSLLAAITALHHLGFTMNTMTMGGLAIAIGEVVDDAVIDVENILRRLRENRSAENPRPAFHVVFDASIEVRSAVIYATFAVVLVFIPLLTLSGVAGRIFSPLGIAYIMAVLASLLVALTVTPALSFLLLARKDLQAKEPPTLRWLKKQYRNLLEKVDRHPKAVIGAVALFLVAGLAGSPFLSGEFLPDLREGHYIVHVTTVPGTSLDESLRLGERISIELLKLPYVRSVAQRTGRAEEGEETRGTNASELDVRLKSYEGRQAGEARSGITALLEQFPGINFAVNTFLTERIEETVSGVTAPVVVNIYGNNLDVLDEKAQEVAAVLAKTPGAVGVQVLSPPGVPQLAAVLRNDDLTRWGFDSVSVLDALHTAYEGKSVGQVYDGDRVFDVIVILDPQNRRRITDVGGLPLRNSDGTFVRLQQLADLYETSGRSSVTHDGGRRLQTVTCSVEGRNLSSFAADAQKRIAAAVSLPAGAYMEFTGTAEARARSMRDLVFHSLFAGAGILLLLSVVLGSNRNVLLVLANLPFALVGGVLIMLASGGALSLGSMVGFVTLFGITLRNSIMMISHYEHLVAFEGMQWGADAALRGASERLAPILMTALVTGLGLLPLAASSGTAGREIEGPMAMVILGGLFTSTTLNLLVLPTLALKYGRFERKSMGL